ncbi:thioredoxin domain protein [Shewanella sediminis HAW-EB3]|uniref:Thioredoxin domain protein n=1 Tax=Shewanella sediminis (strain HAW-EB3) TaxID=425104 RepID=A8FX82_SHESH|nr:tetratricopeptide repeat protein [Shewanella sediminis]ABV37455.1 thioredoxin domain protein [Shewanella sediminis HAW-EB3]
METVLELTKENIQQIVDVSMKQLVVLSFWSQQSPESVALCQTLTSMAQKQSGRFVLAKVDCDKEMEIANYFQIQNVPTTLVLSEGKPIDGFAGSQDEGQISAMLDKHLPAQWELQLNQAKNHLALHEFEPALVLLKQAFAESPNAEVALVYADAQLMAGDLVTATQLLDSVGLADQDSYYQSLKAKLALALDAADTPEIRQLQQAFDSEPSNIAVLMELVKALHQAKRNEEALGLLFTPLSKDITIENGDAKKLFLEILTALGQGNALANQYRRKLYSLLY